MQWNLFSDVVVTYCDKYIYLRLVVRLTETNGKVARLFGLLGIFLEKSNGIKLLYTYRLNCDRQSIFLCLKSE